MFRWLQKGGSQTANDGFTAADSVILRDVLLHILTSWRDDMSHVKAARLDDLLLRLERAPIPTGLQREVRALMGGLTNSNRSHRRNGAEFSKLARELTEAMQATALIDSSLDSRISKLASSIPNSMGLVEAARVTHTAAELRKLAEPIRQRAQSDRMELAGLATDLSTSLRSVGASNTTIADGLSEIADDLRLAGTSEGVRKLRADTIGRIQTLITESTQLRTELKRTREQVGSLEQVVARQSEVIVDMRTKATRDPLTGVNNRGAFEDALTEFVRRTRTMGMPLSLICMDVDHFKQINDTWGHPVGDRVLKRLAEKIRLQVRSDDVVARIGGEEFAVLLPGAHTEMVSGIAERIRSEVEDLSFSSLSGGFSVTMSVGYGALVGNEDGQAFYSRVDTALYQAKRAGRNRVVAA